MNECESAVSMDVTLRTFLATRFSETAVLRLAPGSRPGHHHARGHVARRAHAGPPRPAIGGRRHADHARERPAEGPEAREPHLEADLGHGPLALAQQRHRPLEPAPLEVAMRRLAERVLERADEV